jgi:hypothetical protein
LLCGLGASLLKDKTLLCVWAGSKGLSTFMNDSVVQMFQKSAKQAVRLHLAHRQLYLFRSVGVLLQTIWHYHASMSSVIIMHLLSFLIRLKFVHRSTKCLGVLLRVVPQIEQSFIV